MKLVEVRTELPLSKHSVFVQDPPILTGHFSADVPVTPPNLRLSNFVNTYTTITGSGPDDRTSQSGDSGGVFCDL